MNETVETCKQNGYIFYYSSKNELSDSKCGKWMYFFSDKAFAEQICYRAICEQVVSESKHSDSDNGVAIFYINVDDLYAHKRVIEFFIENRLIKKTKFGKYHNISFKLDSETHEGKYTERGNFSTEIKLERFIDLQTGQWIMSQETLNSIIPAEIKLYSLVHNYELDKETFGVDNAYQYIKKAFPAYIKPKNPTAESKVHFFTGKIPTAVLKSEAFFIVRFRAVFYLKRGFEPFIICKTSLMYPIGKPLETSDIKSYEDGKYYDRYIDFDGKVQNCFPEFTLTRDDYLLFNKNYDIPKIMVLDGCYFE